MCLKKTSFKKLSKVGLLDQWDCIREKLIEKVQCNENSFVKKGSKK